MGDDLFFRAGVGMFVVDGDGLIMVGHRVDVPGAWHVPQGGLQAGEQPVDAVRRELAEETGVAWDDVTVVDEHDRWLAYELPADARSAKTGLGQVQRWFLLRLDGVFDAAAAPTVEFDRWRWVPASVLVAEAWPPRRPVYRHLVSHWADHLSSA